MKILSKCSDIFKAVDIDISEAENAFSSLKKDSQSGTIMVERSTDNYPWRYSPKIAYEKQRMLFFHIINCLSWAMSFKCNWMYCGY